MADHFIADFYKRIWHCMVAKGWKHEDVWAVGILLFVATLVFCLVYFLT